jgi:chemotaxis protein MotB
MNRKRFREIRANQAWMVTFADLSLILLVLFVLIVAYSETDQGKFDSVIDSFNKVGPLDYWSSLGGPALPEPAEGDDKSPVEDELGDVPDEWSDEIRAMIKREEKLLELLQFVRAYTEEQGLKDQLMIEYTARGIEFVLPEVMLFPSGEATLVPEAVRFLKQIAPLLAQIDHTVEIEGHTDNRPIHTVRFPSNWDLSTARSNEVIRYLVEEEGLDPARFKSVGYGEYHPIASNKTEEGRRKNRRVVMVIVNDELQQK